MKKISNKNASLIIILLILILMSTIVAVNHEQINSYIEKAFRADEPELLSYVIYDNQDKNNLKVLIKVESLNGIEYIEDDSGNIINGNGKTVIYTDCTVKENVEKNVKIKEKGKNEISKYILINDETIEENTLKIERISSNIIGLSYIGEIEGYTIFTKTQNDTEWKKYTQPIHLLQLIKNKEEVINSNYKLTISIMMKNEQNNNRIILDKSIDIDTLRIKFDPNGGTGEMDDIIIIDGETVTLTDNTFERDGYKYVGWNTSEDGNGETYLDKASIKPLTDITLYAQWTQYKFYLIENGQKIVPWTILKENNPIAYAENSDHIYISSDGRDGRVFNFRTTNTINLSEYKTMNSDMQLDYIWNGTWIPKFFVTTSTAYNAGGEGWRGQVGLAFTQAFSRQVKTYNIQSLQGNYYVCIGNNARVRIYNLWLEK